MPLFYFSTSIYASPPILHIINFHMDAEEKKWRAKQVLLSKLKDLDSMKQQQKAELTPPPASYETRNQLPKMEPNSKGAMRIDTEEDFKKMPYEGKAKYDN